MAEPTTPWTEFDYAVVDVEGNGQQPPDLVEISVVAIENGTIARPKTWLGKTTTTTHLAQLLKADGETTHLTVEPSRGSIGRLAYDLTDEVSGPALACLLPGRPVPPPDRRTARRLRPIAHSASRSG